MKKLALVTLTTFFSAVVYCQQDFFILKKRNKQIAFFKKDSHIAFQLQSREWIAGYITSVQHDSFYVRPEMVHYTFAGPDTVHYELMHVALNDVFAMPRSGEELIYSNDRIKIIYGNEHWVWIKNGWLFTTGRAAYTTVNITNSLIRNESPFVSNNIGKLGIGVAVFLFGLLLHHEYKSFLHMSKKYHLQSVKVSE